MSSYPDFQAFPQWTGSPLSQATLNAIGGGTLDTGALPVGSWASIILWAKATAQPITAVVTQTLGAGPAALTISTNVTIPAGAQIADTIVMLGDTVEIVFTGGGAGCKLDYAVVPTNTTTNAQVTTGIVNAAARIYSPFTRADVIPNNAWTQVIVPNVDFSTVPALTAVASQIVPQDPGVYAVSGGVLWNTTPTVIGNVSVWRNGAAAPSLVAAGGPATPTSPFAPVYADNILCSAGDVLRLMVYSNAGGIIGGGWLSAALVATL